MSRRPSVASLSSISSGLMKPISLPSVSESLAKTSQSNGSIIIPSRSASFNTNLGAIVEHDPDLWDPDDLFTKHTIAEVKSIQHRLRADAEAKQEELRLMVGERYRDLLQASTSIISIAESSSRVLSALDEVRRSTAFIRPIEGAQAHVGGQGDEHLQNLQSLAAHLKLLLDAPEHLWRFMERKLYLHAAWLFLLSRVVHRSLIRSEEDDDATWRALDVDISEQFPIVQRQWDAVSQFRSQISHKATMTLRENNLTPPEVCAILLTLHLLESRPLPETLATFLAQRTRSLNTSLNWTKGLAPNGDASSPQDSITKSRKVIAREIRQKLKAVLDIVVRTVGISRRIFVQHSDDAPALMHEVLQHVQGENVPPAKSLPSEVALTSQALLTSLPSSNHFILLPTNIRSYKPYIDAAPLLASEQSGQLKQKLAHWFQKAVQNVRSAMELWFAELKTIRELWDTRRWCRTWLASSDGLDPQEIEHFNSALDSVCRQMAVNIWKSALGSIEATFRERLTSAVNIMGQKGDVLSVDAVPVKYLFNAPPVPSIAHSTTTVASNEVSFHAYRSSLKQQIIARTPLLDDVLSIAESRVKDLRNDFDVTQEETETARTLTAQLMEDYGHDAETLCTSLVSALQEQLDQLDDSSDLSLIVFLGRIADHLSSSTTFIENLACNDSTIQDFRAQLATLYTRVLETWYDRTVPNVTATYLSSVLCREDKIAIGPSSSPRPSARILSSLLTLSSATQTLSPNVNAERFSTITPEALRRFIVNIIRELDNNKEMELSVQTSWDLTFLFLLIEPWGSQMQQTKSLILSRLPWPTEAEWPQNVRESIAESLARSQVLLGLILPLPEASTTDQGKVSSLLQLGIPTVDAQYQSALELVKPAARFGLLLVGSSAASYV